MVYYNPRDPRPYAKDTSLTTVDVAYTALRAVYDENRVPLPGIGESRLAQLVQYTLNPYSAATFRNPAIGQVAPALPSFPYSLNRRVHGYVPIMPVNPQGSANQVNSGSQAEH